jgi:hypothetical protein
MRSYMDRYGLTRESLLILSTIVFLFSSFSIAVASKTILAQHKDEINVLRSMGASKRPACCSPKLHPCRSARFSGYPPLKSGALKGT